MKTTENGCECAVVLPLRRPRAVRVISLASERKYEQRVQATIGQTSKRRCGSSPADSSQNDEPAGNIRASPPPSPHDCNAAAGSARTGGECKQRWGSDKGGASSPRPNHRGGDGSSANEQQSSPHRPPPAIVLFPSETNHRWRGGDRRTASQGGASIASSRAERHYERSSCSYDEHRKTHEQ